ncbi:polysaccharide pyruvyl transferase family protein [Oenococcus kitaharae]|uniref:polysaccharide pyruvyl transferase family protein n=1 Tax=Oenococcus TaxID=46254 RepID=UPI0021E735EB|nr:polysaccharide pyruvyl transferase family protein [Oenococcus kitaharae]MCV3296568.1 polysaccharide pyruvyl transferase family protein [Oenococcus kitaharae]
MNRRAILIIGYFRGNVGDDLFVKTLVERYPKENFELLTSCRFARSFLGIQNLSIINKNLFLRGLNFLMHRFVADFSSRLLWAVRASRYKAVVEIGGSIFQQESEKQNVVSPERTELLKKVENYFVIGSNFGPVISGGYISAYHNFFKKTGGVVFRDFKSYDLFSDLSNISYAPDVVFSLFDKAVPFRSRSQHINWVSIVPVDLKYPKRANYMQLAQYAEQYEEHLYRIAYEALRKKMKIRFISFCLDEGDNKCIARIVARFSKEDRQNIVVVTGDVGNIFAALANTEYLIGSRFHAMILAWILGIKQLAIPYSEKTTSVINDLFPKQTTETLNSFCNDDQPFKFKSLVTMPCSLVKHYANAAEQQFAFLDSFLKSKKMKEYN